METALFIGEILGCAPKRILYVSMIANCSNVHIRYLQVGRCTGLGLYERYDQGGHTFIYLDALHDSECTAGLIQFVGYLMTGDLLMRM